MKKHVVLARIEFKSLAEYSIDYLVAVIHIDQMMAEPQ